MYIIAYEYINAQYLRGANRALHSVIRKKEVKEIVPIYFILHDEARIKFCRGLTAVYYNNILAVASGVKVQPFINYYFAPIV